MAAKTDGERIDRLEQVVGILAEDQMNLQRLFAEFVTETRKGFDRVAVQMAETERRFQETDRRFQETDRKMRETDERIDKLVIAIGEYVSRLPPPAQR